MSSQNDLFLTSSDSGKKAYIEMMEATVHAIAASMTDEQAYAGMPPYELRNAVPSDELLPQ